jgi:3-deoxy-7-phosphoheptulonate synthase
MKVGSPTSPEDLVRLCRILNPTNEPGHLTLIHRFGANRIADGLPRLLEAVRSEGCRVGWICDPMHGNTTTASNGLKTRSLTDIEREIGQAFDIHDAAGVPLAGVHIELTGENVTECTGGARGLEEQDLETAYETEVDPRLNYEQSIELAMLMASRMARRRNGHGAAERS